MTEDEMVGWYHGLNGHEFEQTPGDGEVQGSFLNIEFSDCFFILLFQPHQEAL